MTSNSTYYAPEYKQTDVVSQFRNVPRFGNTDRFADISTDEEEYVTGLLVIAFSLLVVTVVWYVAILLFKCCCTKRFGFLGGRTLRPGTQSTTVRVFFIVAAVAALIAGVLMQTETADSLMDILDFFVDELKKLSDFVREGIKVLSSLLLDISKLADKADKVIDDINALECLGGSDNEYMKTLDEIAEALEAVNFQSFTADIEEYQTALNESFVDTEADLDNILKDVDSVVQPLYTAVGVFIITVEAILIAGALAAWVKYSHKCVVCCERFLVLPIIVLVGLIAVVLACVASFVLVMNADGCSGGNDMTPEGTMKDFLDQNEFGADATAMLDYYIVNGCRGVNPYPILEEIESTTAVISKEIDEALSDMNENPQLEQICSGWNEVQASLEDSSAIFSDISRGVSDAFGLVNCDKINPFYVSVVHEGFCDQVPSYLAWTFYTSVVIWIAGLFAVQFRSALRPDATDDNNEHEEAKSSSSLAAEGDTASQGSLKFKQNDGVDVVVY